MNSPAARRPIPDAPEIITFYSYKGGTGRSMALANIAFILAGNGYRVLVIDWDLEAPGLHRYFHPFLKDRDLNTSQGIIDFVVDYATGAASAADAPDNWYVPFGNVLRYASSLDFRFPLPGVIDFIPAGRQGPDYAAKVNSFDWQHFYEQLDGGLFLEFAKKSMAGYHYVLIDSRTGVSDTSGICTVQMPEKLVVCFTPNSQSIEGAAAVAESAYFQRIRPDGTPGLRVLPVLTRVERGELERIQVAKDLARVRFDDLLGHMQPAARDEYWSRVAVPHEPYYAFEEVLSVFAEKPDQPPSMLSIMKVLAEYVTGAGLEFPKIDPAVRESVMDRFSRRMKRQVIRTLSAEDGPVTDLALCADGTRAISGYAKGTAIVWDLETGRQLRTFAVQRARKTAVAISADGRRVAVGSRGFSVWDAETGAVLAESGAFEDVTAIALNQDGTRALSCAEKIVAAWDIAARSRLALLAGHKDWVRAVVLSGDGRLAFTAGDEGAAILWDVPASALLRRFEGHKDWVRSVAVSSDGHLGITGSDDGTAIIWDLVSGRSLHTLRRHEGPVSAVSINGDGKRALTGGKDGRVFTWELETGQPLRLFTGHTGSIAALALSFGGRRAISGGADGKVMLWDTEAGDPVEAPTPAPEAVRPSPSAAAPPRRPNQPPVERIQGREPAPVERPRERKIESVPPKYWFFASFAHSDWDEYLSRFFEDLTIELRLLGAPEGAGFVDRYTLPGQAWNETVAESSNGSRTLLAIYSPAYFRNPGAGRLFTAFLHDRTRRIAPIVWAPLFRIPETAQAVQYFHANFPDVYWKQGLRYMMMRLRKHRDAYREILSVWARNLVLFEKSSGTGLDPLPPLHEVESAFPAGEQVATGPAARFAYLVPTRKECQENGLPPANYGDFPWDWKPFGDRSAGQICQATAAALGLPYEEIDLSEAVLDRNSLERNPVIALLDPNATKIPGLHRLTLELGTMGSSYVLLALGQPSLASEEHLTAAVTQAITEIRLLQISRGSVQQSTSPLPVLSEKERKA